MLKSKMPLLAPEFALESAPTPKFALESAPESKFILESTSTSVSEPEFGSDNYINDVLNEFKRKSVKYKSYNELVNVLDVMRQKHTKKKYFNELNDLLGELDELKQHHFKLKSFTTDVDTETDTNDDTETDTNADTNVEADAKRTDEAIKKDENDKSEGKKVNKYSSVKDVLSNSLLKDLVIKDLIIEDLFMYTPMMKDSFLKEFIIKEDLNLINGLLTTIIDQLNTIEQNYLELLRIHLKFIQIRVLLMIVDVPGANQINKILNQYSKLILKKVFN